MAMRAVFWNVRHGGGARIDAIVGALRMHAPDLIVLAEHRPRTGTRLRHAVAEAGWPEQCEAASPASPNGVLLASRRPIERLTIEPPPQVAAVGAVRLPEFDLVVVGAYLPCRKPYAVWMPRGFEEIAAAARPFLARSALVLADLNTGDPQLDADVPASFTCAGQFRSLQAEGWIDAVRRLGKDRRVYSFRIKNNFRIDHALASPGITGRITRAEYSEPELEAGVSDHKPLVVELTG